MTGLRRMRGFLAAIVVVAVIVFLFRRYLGSDGLLFGDSNFQWDRSLLDGSLEQLRNSWAPAFGGGRPAIITNATTAGLTLLQEAVSFFGIPLSTILAYPLILAIGYAGCWLAARCISRNAFSAHIVAVFFIASPWVWDRVLLGHVLIVAAAMIAAWIVATVLYRARLGTMFPPLLFAECALMLLCDPRISYMVFLCFAVLALHWLLVARRLRARGPALDALVLLVAPVCALMLNAWWTLAFYTLPGINAVRRGYPPLDDVLSYSRYADFAHNVVFSGSFLHFSWGQAWSHGLPLFICWYAAMVALDLLALSGNTGSRSLNLLLRLGVVAAFLGSMGTALLPPSATIWIYAHVPMSIFFRDQNKIEFVALLCMVPLLTARLTRTPSLRAITVVLVLIAAAPVFAGDLRATDGAGLQVFSERQNYVSVLRFLRSQPDFPNFRVAVLPPWSAEVSLSPGEHPVADPFVFQNLVPTLDAKLINTASDMNMIAWRDFANFYEGTDAHSSDTLGNLGIKYAIWNDSATVSPGAVNTPFFNAPYQVVKKAIGDAGLKEVYSDGALHVLENVRFQPLLRTLSRPVIDGALSEGARAVLPARLLGDSAQAVRGALPSSLGVLGVGSGRADACLSTLANDQLIFAYDRVEARADWRHYWVESDYLEQGTGDLFQERLLAQMALPYAFTESSHAVITFPVHVLREGRVSVQGAALSQNALPQYSIDAGPWRPLRFPAYTLGWITLDGLARGDHTLAIRGSSVGTVARAVTVASPTTCPTAFVAMQPLPARPRSGANWLAPGPVSTVNFRETAGRFSFRSSNVAVSDRALATALASSGPIPGPGADGILVDHFSTVVGQPFNLLTGYHHIEFFARGAILNAGGWSHQFRDASTGEAAVRTFEFNPRYTEEGVAAEVSNVPPGSTILLRVPFLGNPRSAEVRVSQGGLLLMRYPLAIGATSYVTAPAYNDKITVVVHRENDRSPLRILPLDARAGVGVGDTVIALPSRAVPVRANATIFDASHSNAIEPLTLAGDGRALVPTKTFESLTVVRGSTATLAYSGLKSSVATDCAVSVNYETASGPVLRSVADVALGPNPIKGQVAIPIEPRASALLPKLDCRSASAVLALDSASLAFKDGVPGAVLVSVPKVSGTAPTAIAHQPVSAEEYRLKAHPATVVSVTSYDDAWRYAANRHVLINGAENGWLGSAGDRVVYTIQAKYAQYALVTAALWIALGIWLGAGFVFEWRRRRPEPTY